MSQYSNIIAIRLQIPMINPCPDFTLGSKTTRMSETVHLGSVADPGS